MGSRKLGGESKGALRDAMMRAHECLAGAGPDDVERDAAFGALVVAAAKHLSKLMHRYGPHEPGLWLASLAPSYLLSAEPAAVPGWNIALEGLMVAAQAFDPDAAKTDGQVAAFIQLHVKSALVKEYHEEELFALTATQRKKRAESMDQGRDGGGLWATFGTSIIRLDDEMDKGTGSGSSRDSRADLIKDACQPSAEKLQLGHLLRRCLDEILKADRNAAHLVGEHLGIELADYAETPAQLKRILRSATLPKGVEKLGSERWGAFIIALRGILVKHTNARDLDDLKGLLGGGR